MPSILELPVELLLLINKDLYRADTQNLALSCRSLHSRLLSVLYRRIEFQMNKLGSADYNDIWQKFVDGPDSRQNASFIKTLIVNYTPPKDPMVADHREKKEVMQTLFRRFPNDNLIAVQFIDLSSTLKRKPLLKLLTKHTESLRSLALDLKILDFWVPALDDIYPITELRNLTYLRMCLHGYGHPVPPQPQEKFIGITALGQTGIQDIYEMLVQLKNLEHPHLQRFRGPRVQYSKLPPIKDEAPLPRLKALTLEHCQGIGQLIAAIIKQQPPLERLKLWITHPMDVVPTYRLLTETQGLKELYLSVHADGYPNNYNYIDGPTVWEFKGSWKWADLIANHSQSLEYLSTFSDGDFYGEDCFPFPDAIDYIAQEAHRIPNLKEIFCAGLMFWEEDIPEIFFELQHQESLKTIHACIHDWHDGTEKQHFEVIYSFCRKFGHPDLAPTSPPKLRYIVISSGYVRSYETEYWCILWLKNLLGPGYSPVVELWVDSLLPPLEELGFPLDKCFQAGKEYQNPDMVFRRQF